MSISHISPIAVILCNGDLYEMLCTYQKESARYRALRSARRDDSFNRDNLGDEGGFRRDHSAQNPDLLRGDGQEGVRDFV